MTPRDTVTLREWTGAAATAEGAVEKGLKKLRLTRDQVEVKILGEKTSGLFSLFGFRRTEVKLVEKPRDDRDDRYEPRGGGHARSFRDDRGPRQGRNDRPSRDRDDRGPRREDRDRGPRRDDRSRGESRGPAPERRPSSDRGGYRDDRPAPRGGGYDRPPPRDDRGPAPRDDRGSSYRDDQGGRDRYEPRRDEGRGAPPPRDNRPPSRDRFRDDRGPVRDDRPRDNFRDDRGPAPAPRDDRDDNRGNRYPDEKPRDERPSRDSRDFRRPEPRGDAPAREPREVPTPEALLDQWKKLLGWDDLEGARKNGESGDITYTFNAAAGDRLLPHNAEVLEALEHLMNTVRSKGDRGVPRVFLEVEGYAPPADQGVIDEARRAAEEVKRTGEPIRMDPMSARDRRLVHQALAGHPDVETSSEGEGSRRLVVVRPKGS